MKYDRYILVGEANDLSVFEFESRGSKGVVRKRIVFSKTEVNGIYNLAFGDLDDSGRLNDAAISGDRDKVLATIVQAVGKYTTRYPGRCIYFCGTTPARTRLYRMVIGLHLEELTERFEIFAEVDGSEDYVPFEKNMILDGFLIRRRITLFTKIFS